MSDTNEITFEDVKNSPTVETPLPNLTSIDAGPPPGSMGAYDFQGGYMDGIKEETEALIARVKERTRDLSPAAQRAAAIAITHYETAMLWAVRARFL
jgi:hypothetical protein